MIRNPLFITITATVIALVALGTFVFVTDAPSYAGTNSETCANCHVMDSMYENYYHSAHRPWTDCSSCHLPHDNLVSYWFEKGRQGAHDIYVFSTGQTPDVIRANEHSKKIIQENCIYCHEDAVESITMGAPSFTRYCWDCHRDTAHGARGISIVPYQDSVFYPTR